MMQKRNQVLPHGGKNPSVRPGIQIAIKRSGSSVNISLQCNEDYCAIELYDRLTEAAQRGKVTIDLEAK